MPERTGSLRSVTLVEFSSICSRDIQFPMLGRRALLALLVFLCTRTGFAQYGAAPNGYYPSGYGGDIFTGIVSAVDEMTGQITISFHTKKKTETFVGHLQKSCDVPSKDGTAMTALDLPIGTGVSVFFVTSVRKEGDTVVKENSIIGIMFHSWDGHPVAQPSKKIIPVPLRQSLIIGAVLDHLAPPVSNPLDTRSAST